VGLGKTVICLAMILSNAAPALPASGSAASELSQTAPVAPVNVSADSTSTASTMALTPFWDPDWKVTEDPEDEEKADDDDDDDGAGENDSDKEEPQVGGRRKFPASKKHGSILSRGTLVVVRTVVCCMFILGDPL
jgi:hypothetical protein